MLYNVNVECNEVLYFTTTFKESDCLMDSGPEHAKNLIYWKGRISIRLFYRWYCIPS